MERERATDRLLGTLERLLAVPASEPGAALTHACNAVAEALRADKVDAFLYDESRDSLVALGTSTQPLSGLQRRLGLDVLPVSNGGRVAYVYETGQTFLSGQLVNDPEELRGVKEGLKIHSKLGVPLDVGELRLGMLMIASQQPDFFGPSDVEYAEAVAPWVAIVAHRAQLVQALTDNAVEQGRRSVAEELVTVLAHDLRNYVTPITARLQLLHERSKRQERADDVRDTDLALRGLDRLNRLIGDILDIARLDQGIFRLDVRPVDLVGLARESVKAMTTPDRHAAVEASDEVVVYADPERARQCIENLLANAVQHSPPGAAVTMIVRLERHADRYWGSLSVHNEGPGIPVELLPRLFERYAAGPGSRGLGLGLYLAKRIAVAHGGDLSVESPPGRGARFELRLPCYQE
jgi:two-component system, OmpR family, sensor kinase